MSAVYGPEWQVELRTQNKDAAQAGGSDDASQAESNRYDGSRVAGGQVDTGADGVPAAETAPERQSAAGTHRSFGAETASDVPPSAPVLRQRLMVAIDPSEETVAQFTKRLIRIAQALDAKGDPVAEEDLAEILSRAEYVTRIRELASDAQVTCLKDLLASVLTNDGMHEGERTGRHNALAELLRARGQRPSTNPERLFSTASNSPQQSPDRPTLEARILTPKPLLSQNPKCKRA